MSPEKQREIASMGGKTHGKEFFQAIGSKGGKVHSRQHMAEIGRKGGSKVSQDRRYMSELGKKGVDTKRKKSGKPIAQV